MRRCDLLSVLNCGEACGGTVETEIGSVSFSAADWFVLWLISSLFNERSTMWQALSIQSGSRVSYAVSQLLTGASLPGEWLRGWHWQVTVQSVQQNSLALLDSYWLPGGNTGPGDVSWSGILTCKLSPWWSSEGPQSGFCFLHVTSRPLSSQDFWPWALLQWKLHS